jgi:hypothetical protein
MTSTGEMIEQVAGTGNHFMPSPYNFGAPSGGVREHPMEMSTTGIFPYIPVTILNDAISVKAPDPSSEGQQK